MDINPTVSRHEIGMLAQLSLGMGGYKHNVLNVKALEALSTSRGLLRDNETSVQALAKSPVWLKYTLHVL